MSDPQERFEEQLRSLRPRRPSNDLRARIGASLSPESERTTRAAARRLAWAGLVAAAGIMIGVLVWRMALPAQPIRQPTMVRPLPEASAASDDWPTDAAYSAALRRSPQELDALLARHARMFLPPMDPAQARASAPMLIHL